MKQERVGSPRKIAASRVNRFTESVIREMTRLADEHKAINLAQGFPDFDAPDELKEAAIRAIQAGVNQYPVTWGSPTLRGAIATKYGRFGWPDLDPETEIVVTCGSTEAMASTFLALVEPGQEVLLFGSQGVVLGIRGAATAAAICADTSRIWARGGYKLPAARSASLQRRRLRWRLRHSFRRSPWGIFAEWQQ